MSNLPYDHDEHVKETFAYFGRAYYMSNVFEEGLSLAILQLDFLKSHVEEMRRVGSSSFDRAKYELSFEKFVAQQNSQTLGNLIRKAYRLVNFDELLQEKIEKAKSKRDFLAHHFFRERAEDFVTRAGRDRMIVELEGAHQVFADADWHLSEFMGPFMSRSGVVGEKFSNAFNEFVEKYMAAVANRVE